MSAPAFPAILIRRGRPGEGARALAIWRAAIGATHGFLAPADRNAIDAMLCGVLPDAPLWFAVDPDDRPLAFMLIDGGHMEALFVDPPAHAKGVGAALVRHALEMRPGMTVDVNEQNEAAAGFYAHLGFRPTGRSALDGQGRPYPLIHLVHRC